MTTGVPATESLKGITKKEREQQGKLGGVVRIAYLTALAPRLGETAFQVLGDQGGVVPSAGEVNSSFPPPPQLPPFTYY